MTAARLLVTTTRHTNQRVRSLVKELAASLYGAVRVTRGKMSVPELLSLAKGYGATRVVIVGRGQHGNPGRVVFLDATAPGPEFYPLILGIKGVKLAREMGVRPTPPPGPVPVLVRAGEALDFAHDLAAAMDLDLVEGEPGDFSGVYPRVLEVEYVGGRVLYVLKFVDTGTGRDVGPKLFVSKAVPRRIVYEAEV